MTTNELISLLFSAGALLISCLALRGNLKATKQQAELGANQTELQNRLVQIEEAREQDRLAVMGRAALRARIETTPKRDWRLVIENFGASSAIAVKTLLDGKLLASHPAFFANQEVHKTIPELSKVSYLLSRPGPFEINVSWTDDSGKPGRYAGPITT